MDKTEREIVNSLTVGRTIPLSVPIVSAWKDEACCQQRGRKKDKEWKAMIQLVDLHKEIKYVRVLNRIQYRLLGKNQSLIIVLRVLR